MTAKKFNLHFRKLFCIFEQNLWNASLKELFFSVYLAPGYICDCSHENSMFIHILYNENKISFLYIFILIYMYIA